MEERVQPMIFTDNSNVLTEELFNTTLPHVGQSSSHVNQNENRVERRRRLKNMLLCVMPSLVDWFLEDTDNGLGTSGRTSRSAAELYTATLCYRRKVRKPVGFKDAILNKRSLDDFREHFRMSRKTFEMLLKMLSDKALAIFTKKFHGGNAPLPIETYLLITLWYMVTSESLSKIGNRFGVVGSTAFRCIRMVTEALNAHIYKDLVRWPGSQEQLDIQDGFQKQNGLPHVVGAMSCLHLACRTPKDSPDSYRNKTGKTSLILQAVCDHKLKLIDCYCSCPGGMDSFEVLKTSNLFQRMQDENPSMISKGSYLVADETYPLLPWILTPVRETTCQSNFIKVFNDVHKETKGAIDTALRALLTRFHRLRNLDMDMDFACSFVCAVCTVYNHCLISGEPCIVDNISIRTSLNGRNQYITDHEGMDKERCKIMQNLSRQRGFVG